MKNFAAIDFETANKERSSICSVGIVIVKNGIIADRIYRLIRPRPHYYSYWNTQIHGLKIEDTADAADFPTVWREIEPAIAGLPLVAHNSVFDEGCLKAAFKTFGMEYPDTRSIAPAVPPGKFSERHCPTISCIPSHVIADTYWKIITMRWLMPRHAPGSPCKS